MKGNSTKYLGFNDLLLLLIGIPILGVLTPFLFFSEAPKPGEEGYVMEVVISSIYCAIHWFGNRFIIVQCRKRFPGIQSIKLKLLTQIGASILFTLSVCSFLDVCLPFLSANDPHQPKETEIYIASFILTIIVMLIYESVFLFQNWRNSMLEAEQLKKENVLSQLQSLKDQVNPHFLFNSLNTLVALIPDEPDKAIRFVQHLSKCYRYILEIRDKEVITLKEELAFLDAFRFLLETRFGENINFQIEVPEEALEKEIVPLALQILIENAIKHNIVSTEKPLFIQIYQDHNNLIVKNNLQKKVQEMPSTKTGLNNIKNRYKYLADKTVDIIVTHTEFIVSLPLLQYKQV